jgi:riboflavin kinase / FMN adenylyltransferase
MQEIHLDKLSSDFFSKGSLVTLGNFDGIHLGHLSILEKLQSLKAEKNLPSILVTFFPNPAIVLGKNKSHKSIYSERSKKEILAELKIDFILTIPFTEEFSKIKAEDFIDLILKKKLNANHIIIGFNHFFGKDREGNFDFLKQFSAQYNFTVEKMDSIVFDKEQISSSVIRNFLQNGLVEKVSQFLNRNFHLYGKVIKGFQRGRTLGFPTANLQIEENILIPKIAVYAVRVYYKNEKFFGMMNIGRNPTFENQELSLEVHIFNFTKDIYDEELRIEFVQMIREEKKFNSIEELKAQLDLDKIDSEKILTQ